MSLPTHKLLMEIEADHEACRRIGEEFEDWAGTAGAKSQDWAIVPLQAQQAKNSANVSEARALLREILNDMGGPPVDPSPAQLDEIIAGGFIKAYAAGLSLVTEFFDDAATTLKASAQSAGEVQPSDSAAPERGARRGPRDGGSDQLREEPGGQDPQSAD